MISLKHRIIGALFLIALMVIVIPDILDDSPSLYLDQVDPVPTRPDAPKLDQLNIAPAWSILVGRFDPTEGQKWLDTFHNLGWPSYATRAGNDTRELKTRIAVYLGPNLEKTTLEAKQQELLKQFALKSNIVAYQPTAIAIRENTAKDQQHDHN